LARIEQLPFPLAGLCRMHTVFGGQLPQRFAFFHRRRNLELELGAVPFVPS
jgi:hypothetical protein